MSPISKIDLLKKKPQKVTVGSMDITVTPGQQANSYDLVSTATDRDYLLGQFPEAKGKLTLQTPKKYPKWLTNNAVNKFESISPVRAFHYHLKLTGAPKTLTLSTVHVAEKSTKTRNITLLPKRAYKSNPHNLEIPYPSLAHYSWNSKQHAALPDNFNFDHLQPVKNNQNGLTFTLPEALDAVCQLSIDSNAHYQGQPLIWLEDKNDQNKEKGIAVYKLYTKDYNHHTFNGLTLTTTLNCEGLPSWQEIKGFTTSPSAPWLLDIKQLGSDVSLSMSATDFEKRYHFINVDDNGIALRNGETGYGFKHDETLANVLVDGKWLRLGTTPNRIFHLTTDKKVCQKQWTVDF